LTVDSINTPFTERKQYKRQKNLKILYTSLISSESLANLYCITTQEQAAT
jgi:hypothetical protein